MTKFSVTAAVLAATVITLVEGAASPLPDVALGSLVLFHLERLLALLAGATAVLVIAHRAARGELPTELSTQGVKYAPAPAIRRVDQAVTAELDRLRERVSDLERQSG